MDSIPGINGVSVKLKNKGKLLEDIRQASNKGLALGNEHFIADIE